jgi:hypothetical protein
MKIETTDFRYAPRIGALFRKQENITKSSSEGELTTPCKPSGEEKTQGLSYPSICQHSMASSSEFTYIQSNQHADRSKRFD